ncbi:MAG: DUF2490 domain-containing protein [Weeksellaceae bacterium]|nr:DUF2490 domain-containing protein [Weeksellaceae bacterium]
MLRKLLMGVIEKNVVCVVTGGFWRYLSCVMLCLLMHGYTMAQEKWTHDEQFWVGYMTQSRVHDNWSLWNDTHWVPESFFLLRTGLTFHAGDAVPITSTAGIAKLWIYPAQRDLRTFRPEVRPWGQTTLSHTKNRSTFTHRLRYDARFRRKLQNDVLLPGYDFNWRLRYMLNWRYAFDFSTPALQNTYLVLSNEILYNVGGVTVGGVRMDQNRASVMVGKNLGNVSVQMGYMNFISQANRDNLYFMKNTLVFWIFHRLDFRKKNTVDATTSMFEDLVELD